MKNLLLLFVFLPVFIQAQTGVQRYFFKVVDSPKLSKTTIDSVKKILNKRLQYNGYKNSYAAYSRVTKQFVVSGRDSIDSNYIKTWLIKPFRAGIYETYTIREISGYVLRKKRTRKIVSLQNEFLQLLHVTDEMNYQHRLSYLGNLKLADTARFQKVIAALKDEFPTDLIFTFPKKLSSPQATSVEVYALKNNKSRIDINGVLNECSAVKGNNDYYDVKMKFNEKGADLFSSLTRSNIDKAVAIVIDNRVYTCPFVYSEITMGSMLIASQFSEDEADQIAYILKQGVLPVKLSRVR